MKQLFGWNHEWRNKRTLKKTFFRIRQMLWMKLVKHHVDLTGVQVIFTYNSCLLDIVNNWLVRTKLFILFCLFKNHDFSILLLNDICNYKINTSRTAKLLIMPTVEMEIWFIAYNQCYKNSYTNKPNEYQLHIMVILFIIEYDSGNCENTKALICLFDIIFCGNNQHSGW